MDVQGSCRLEESGSRGECRSGGATSAQEGEERRRREEWRRRVAQGVQIRREATSRRRGKKPQESAADQGSCRGDAAATVQTDLAPPPPPPPTIMCAERCREEGLEKECTSVARKGRSRGSRAGLSRDRSGVISVIILMLSIDVESGVQFEGPQF